MLALGSPKIDFQHENPNCFDRLMEELGKFVTDEDIQEEKRATMSTPSAADQNQLAFQVRGNLISMSFLFRK
jgi:hypothetical protein